MTNSKNLTLQISNIAAFIILVIVNALSEILPLNGKYTSEISDSYPNLFTPAGYVFSIWSIIYTLLLIFTIYQATPKQREKPFLHKISYLFALSSIANITWLVLWHYEKIVLSLIPMFALLGTLIAIYLRLHIGKSNAPLKEKLCVHLPFSVYLGWITVAPIANVAAALVAINWNGWGLSDTTWTALVIIVATIITLTVIATRKDAAYSLVIIWALTGIIAKQTENQTIIITAAISAIAITTALITKTLKPKLQKKP